MSVPAESLDTAMGSFLRTVADLERARRHAAHLFELCAAVEDALSDDALDDFDRNRNARALLRDASTLAGAR